MVLTGLHIKSNQDISIEEGYKLYKIINNYINIIGLSTIISDFSGYYITILRFINTCKLQKA
jgi:hypothetical protein